MSCQKCGSTGTYCGCDEETAIAERDALREQVETRTRQIIEARQQRDDAIHERDILKWRAEELGKFSSGADFLYREIEDAHDECDAALAELAALKKRIADAPTGTLSFIHQLIQRCYWDFRDAESMKYVLLRLEDTK